MCLIPIAFIVIFTSVTVWFQHFIVVISFIYIFILHYILIISVHSILKVPEVISRIRQVSKSVLKGDAKPKQEADEAFYNSQKFEVLYCGKVDTHTHTHITYFHMMRHRCWLWMWNSRWQWCTKRLPQPSSMTASINSISMRLNESAYVCSVGSGGPRRMPP